jgi:hypothetical protein
VPVTEPAGAAAGPERAAGAADGARRQSTEQGRGAGAMLRLWWMIAGNVVLLFAAIYIATAARGWRLSPVDLVFWVTVLTLLGARFLDISWYRGTTSSGEPATMAHFRRYALLLLAIGVALWAGAHFVSRVSAA